MSDSTHFLVLIFFGLFAIIGILYRWMAKKYSHKQEKREELLNQAVAPHMKKDFDTDVVNNPIFSDLEVNINHDDFEK